MLLRWLPEFYREKPLIWPLFPVKTALSRRVEPPSIISALVAVFARGGAPWGQVAVYWSTGERPLRRRPITTRGYPVFGTAEARPLRDALH